MKIKEVILEIDSWYDKFRQKRGEISQLLATKKKLTAPPSPEIDQDELPEPSQSQPAEPNQQPTQQPAAATQQPENKPKLAPGVTIIDTEPVILQVGKKLYYIMDDGLWHEQGNRNPVDATWNSFLNNQMDIALLGKPSVPPSGEKMSAPVQQPSSLTPAQTRQQKQAAAAAQARSQLGIKQ